MKGKPGKAISIATQYSLAAAILIPMDNEGREREIQRRDTEQAKLVN